MTLSPPAQSRAPDWRHADWRRAASLAAAYPFAYTAPQRAPPPAERPHNTSLLGVDLSQQAGHARWDVRFAVQGVDPGAAPAGDTWAFSTTVLTAWDVERGALGPSALGARLPGHTTPNASRPLACPAGGDGAPLPWCIPALLASLPCPACTWTVLTFAADWGLHATAPAVRLAEARRWDGLAWRQQAVRACAGAVVQHPLRNTSLAGGGDAQHPLRWPGTPARAVLHCGLADLLLERHEALALAVGQALAARPLHALLLAGGGQELVASASAVPAPPS